MTASRGALAARGIGTIRATSGGLAEARLPLAAVGAGVRVSGARRPVPARVVGVRGSSVLLAPFGALDGVAAGDRVEVDESVLALPLGTPLLGRAVDALNAPLDGRPRPRGRPVAVRADANCAPGDRVALDAPLWTGVRAIDGPLTFARGARIGLFGAPGAGKSTLLASVTAGTSADAVVVALIGERGREAERALAACDARTTLICATADRPPAERIRAAEVAFAQAAALRARGLHVLLVVDSLARVCAAARELALAAGEPPGRGGYPPSVFALQARLLESAGAVRAGSVTLVATVLSDGPDPRDPVSDAARAALDGHLVLSERLAAAGHFPAIDVPASVSRTASAVTTAAHAAAAAVLRRGLAALEASSDARSLGVPVADPFLARCVAAEAEIGRFLRQGAAPSEAHVTLTELLRLADTLV